MKVTLINPPYPEHAHSHPPFIPLGIAYLGAIALQAGHEVNVIDCQAEKLLFAAQNGNFYALNLSNGTLAWKTQLANSIPSESGVSPVIVDTENQEVYWACGRTSYNGSPGNFSYEGTLYRMNLSTGQNLTKAWIQGDASGSFYTQNNPVLGLALLKNTAYLTVQNDLWVLNKTDLASIKTEHFDDSLLQPIAAYGQVYVSGGVYAIAYKDIE